MRMFSRFALLLACLCLGNAAMAFPDPVHNRVWAVSQPWLPVNSGGAPWVGIYLYNLTTDCTDPITGRGLSLCDSPAPIAVTAHLFASGAGGEINYAKVCTQTTCMFWWQVDPSVTNLAFLLHGDVGQRGRLGGRADVYSWNGTMNLLSSQPLVLSDNIMLDVAGPPGGFDLEAVLVPDPAENGLPGNYLNDYLGVDATELWLLDINRRVVGADVLQRGPGAAARLDWNTINGANARYVVARPWIKPPPGFTVSLGGSALTYALGPAHVGAGRMRLIVNDWHYADTDDDGLSNSVEAVMWTCDGASARAAGRACMTTANFLADPSRVFMDPRDTDGDGISDAAEVLGSDVAYGTLTTLSGACRSDASPTRIAGAAQTFPLWGFNPRHKDALVEIDMGPLDTPCSTTLSGCGGAYTEALPPAAGSLASYLTELQTWHDLYAELPSSRVNNPDNRDGIEVHFDVSTTLVSTTAHGSVSQFLMVDAAGVPQPGRILYAPGGGGSGSTCSCGQSTNCADFRHGGYAHHASVNQIAGGGGSECNSDIGCGLGSGASCAHEMGHHLGLSHGGPNQACNNNPFGLDEARAWDLRNENKFVHYSQ